MFSKISKARVLRKQTITEATIIISVIAFLSKIVGYLRDALTANYFGTSYQVDAFVVASRIPTMILGLFSGGMQAIVIRMYAEKKASDSEKAKIFVNQIFFVFSVILLVVTILIVILSTFSVKLVAWGFSGKSLALASEFLKLLAILGYLNIMVGFFTGLFQAEKQFLYPAFIGLIANMFVPLSILIFTPSVGIRSEVIGHDLFGFAYFIFLYLFLVHRWEFFKKFNIKHIDWKDITEFTRLMFPAIIVSSMSVIYQITDTTVASFLPLGSIAILGYAQTIFTIPYSLLAASIAVSVYPSLSSYAVSKDNNGYVGLFKKSIYSLSYLMAPISVVFTVLSTIIVRILFQRGAFDAHSTAVTASCVSMYSLGLFAIAIADIFRRVFFSFKDTKTPMNISIASAVLNLIFDIILAKYMGVSGIALATTIVTFSSLTQYVLYFKKKRYVTGLGVRKIYAEIAKIIFASIVISLLAFFSKHWLPSNLGTVELLYRFGMVSFVLGIIYIGITWILKTESFSIVLEYFKNFKPSNKLKT